MTEETIKALADIAQALGLEHDNCECGKCCDCTTPRAYESSSSRYNDQSAFAAAESQKQYLQHRDLWFGEMLAKVRQST